jgi:hypothetical protein
MTFSEYLTYKAPPSFKDELIHGEISLSASAKAEHQEICKRLERLLDAVISSGFIAQRDAALYVAGEEGPRPDVFVIRRDRWNQARRSVLGYPEGVPELVIEVRSASNCGSRAGAEAVDLLFRCELSGFLGGKSRSKGSGRVRASAPPRLLLGHSLDLPAEIGGSISVEGIFE